MNFLEMQKELQRLLKLEGWTEVQPTDEAPNYPALINEALELFSMEAEYRTSFATFNTVANQAQYNLNTMTLTPVTAALWKLVTDAWYGVGANATTLKSSSVDQTRSDDEQWYIATANTPDRFFMIQPGTVYFYPPPDAVLPVRIVGIQAEEPLVNDGDIPLAASHYHRSICRLGAWCYGEGFAQGEAVDRLKGYYDKAMQQAADYQLWTASQNVKGLQRNVRRRGIQRVLLTGEDSCIKSV